MSKVLGLDAGNGAFKLYGPQGGTQTLSQIALGGMNEVSSTLGLRRQKAPLKIVNAHGAFYVGAGAHDFGRPVGNLDVERFNGTPEMVALFHGAMTDYLRQHGDMSEALTLIVGLPQEILTEDLAERTKESIRAWLVGEHQWVADGKEIELKVRDVKVAAQVSGGLFDYLLDDQGKFIPERKKALTAEVGVVSVGFGTVELLVVRDRVPLNRFMTGTASGVQRLLEIVNAQGLYSLGELDSMLREGSLDVTTALPIWEREVRSVINEYWSNNKSGKVWRRFERVILLGGGSLLLKDTLPLLFDGKAYVPDNPILSIARGLYKMSLLKKAG